MSSVPTDPWRQAVAAGRAVARGLIHLVYPNLCWTCGAALAYDQQPFCDTCRNALVNDPLPTCPRCAASVGPYVYLDEGCTSCHKQSFAFDGVLRLGPYDGLLRDVVLRLKNLQGDGIAEAVGELWGQHAATELAALGANLIVPVPLHWWRRWTRGYNQSEALARALATAMKLPCQTRLLRRVRPTPPQHVQTSATARRDNVKGAFACRSRKVHGKTVLLVDDVMTTGSTAHEAARALKAAGAARIVVAVLARATG